MAAAEQIKSLIKSFGEGDDSRFYATAMQIAAAEARNGHIALAEELKKLIDKAKGGKREHLGVIKSFPASTTNKELNDLLDLIHPYEKMTHMVLKPMVKKRLMRVLDEQRKFEVLRQNNLFPRKKLLFIGPPGCGKTMSARMLAGELGLPLFLIRLDGLISRYMGESISKLRLIFDAMHQMRAVYLFDEFDSIGTARLGGNDIGEMKRVLNTFLLQIEKDDSGSLIIAATNLPETLDKALFRRFDEIIQFPFPDKEEIIELFERELPLKGNGKALLEKIAEESTGLSFAEINRITQDVSKDKLVYGVTEITEEKLIEYIQQRKHIF